jgi:hypothetical protein
VKSMPVDWYKEQFKEKKGETEYDSSVLIHRKGDFVMPVDVLVSFDNGDKVRERWDGQDRWVRYTYEKKAKVATVEIDPDHKIYLDRNNLNNSYVVEANGKATSKLNNYWTFVTQLFGQVLAWWLV